MTVSSTTSRWSYNGNGSTDTFAYTTKIFATSDLSVYVDGTLKTLTTHYTVTGAGDANGGNVVFTSGNIPASGTANVVIVKDVPYTQPSALPLGGSFLSTIVEGMVDRLTILVQQSLSTINRTLRQAPADAVDIGTLPVKATRAGKLLAFDADGDPVAQAAADLDLSIVSAFAATLLDDDDATAAQATLGLVINTDVLAPNGSGASLTAQPWDFSFYAGFDADGVKKDLAVQPIHKVIATRAFTVTGEAGKVETAPTDAALIVDILKNGTTIYATKPQFAATATTLTAGTLKTDGTATFAAGDIMTVSVTQIGSTEPGEGLTFGVKGATA